VRYLVGFLIGGAAAASVAVVVCLAVPPRFPKGASAAAVDISGMTRKEAELALAAWWRDRQSVVLNLSAPATHGSVYSLSPQDLGIALDERASVAQAARSTPPVRFRPVYADAAQTQQTTARWSVDRGRFNAFVAELAEHNREAGRPKLRFRDDKVVIERGEAGLVLDPKRTLAAITSAVLAGRPEATLAYVEPPPRPEHQILSQIDTELASWTTYFGSSTRSRRNNIRLATEALDNQILMPGQALSYNDVVGARTAARGFGKADMFVGGRHVPGIGGGVCQVSSTLYNAVVLAGLEVVERYNHQLAVGYVPIGRDATVDFGTRDFVFRNSTEFPTAVLGECSGGKLTFRILGSSKSCGRTYKVVVTNQRALPFETVERLDESLEPGETKVLQKGGRGFRCRAWRYVYEGDKLVEKELLSNDYYMPYTRIVAKGPPVEEPQASALPEDSDMAAAESPAVGE
jgi:vancomycin resistance protein YoaR